MKNLAYLMLLIVFSNMLLVSATDSNTSMLLIVFSNMLSVIATDSNTSSYSKEIEKIDKEVISKIKINLQISR